MDKLLPITGVGSLPHKSIESAINFSLKFDIPFLPELIHLDGNMTKASKNSCFNQFIEKTKSLNLIKVQSPSFEINTFKVDAPTNAIHFIDAPFIKDLKDISSYGLHCCDDISLEKVLELSPTHFSFDARFISNPRVFIQKLLENSIIPVVGIISVHDSQFSRCSNYIEWKKVLRDYSMSCWISPACGLDGYTTDECEEIYQELQSIKSEILQLS